MNGIAELSHRRNGALDLNTETHLEPAGKKLGSAQPAHRRCEFEGIRLPGTRTTQALARCYVFRESLGRNVANLPSCCPYHRCPIKR